MALVKITLSVVDPLLFLLQVHKTISVQHAEPQHFLKFKYYNHIVVFIFHVFNVDTTACNINIHMMRESPDF